MDDEGPLSIIAGSLARHRQAWRSLDEIERNLTRVGNGFALVVLTIAAAVFFGGMRGIGAILLELVTSPADAWRGGLFLGLIAYGAVRFVLGFRRVAGLCDGVRAWNAVLGVALGAAATIYLWPILRSAAFETSQWTFDAIGIGVLTALWYALAGAARLVVIFWPRSSAYDTVVSEIEAQEFSWDDENRR